MAIVNLAQLMYLLELPYVTGRDIKRIMLNEVEVSEVLTHDDYISYISLSIIEIS